VPHQPCHSKITRSYVFHQLVPLHFPSLYKYKNRKNKYLPQLIIPLSSPSIHFQKPKLYTFEEQSEKAVSSVVAVVVAVVAAVAAVAAVAVAAAVVVVAVVGKGREAENLMMKFERN
jgi:hypothetical protein